MALRTLTSPNKNSDASGMHTPAKNVDSSFEGENLINSLKKRVASTALRPKATGHFNLDFTRLETSGLSEISSDAPVACRQLNIGDESDESPPPIPPAQAQRASSLWLEQVISEGESLAIKIRQDREQMEALQKSQLNDCSSLGILTESAMATSFNKTNVLSDTYKSLMKIKEKQKESQDTSTDSDNKSEGGNVVKGDDSTLINSNASCSSVNFSNINAGDADSNPFTAPQNDLGFDSKDFMSADADFSAINKQIEQDEKESQEVIPSPYRLDLNEFSGITGEGEIEVRHSWLNPGKRKQSSDRYSIGEYFATKSSNMKELIKGIHPNRDSLQLHSPVKSYSSPLPTGLRPEYATQSDPSQTIDLCQDDDEGNKTITLDATVADNSVQCLDLTLVPGRDSVMSLSTIRHLLDSDKGVNTLAEHMMDVAQNHKSTKKPTPNTSRETFVVTPPQQQQQPKSPAASRIPKLMRVANSMGTVSQQASTSVTPNRMRKSTPIKPKRRSPGRVNNYKSPLSKQSTNPISTATAESLHKKILEQKKPKIQLPLQVEGARETFGVFHGVTNIPINMFIPVTNISTSVITCSVLEVANSKYLEVKPETPVVIQPAETQNMNIAVCALLSGSHFVTVEVQVKSEGIETSHSVDPVKLCIEPPKVCIVSASETNTIDFGLCPEDTRKYQIFTVKNLGTCNLPLQISIEQCSDGSCFYLLVPAGDEEIDVAGTITMHLPGSAQSEEPTSQELFLLFVAPTLDNMRANKDGRATLVELEGKITVRLDIPGNDCVLATSVVRGQVGHTQMMVTEAELTLHAGISVMLGVKNAGIVPLDLTLVASALNNSEKDLSVMVEPSTFMLNPDDRVPVKLTWNPPVGLESSSVQRELHLMYDGLIADHIVTLNCCPRVPEYSDLLAQHLPPLPVRTTRPQLAWGSLSPGLTSQQFVSFKNTSNASLLLQVKICGIHTEIEPPFKVLSEAKEVTRELEIRLKPGHDQKVAVMFCPQRPGPASAYMMLISSHPIPYTTKKILLTGYGGQSVVILRKVASAQGRSWLNLSPGLGDHVDGTFYLVNTGNLPAYAHITSSIGAGLTCSVTVKPDRVMVTPQGNECINVRLSNVSGILSKSHSGEIKTLASLTVHWINEVTRNRLRRLVNHFSNSEKSHLMRLEQSTTLLEILESHIEGEETAVPESEFVSLRDFSVSSAASLIKDLASIHVDLRAEGTGVNHTRATETETLSPFVSFLDSTMLVDPLQASGTSSKDEQVNWSVSPREVALHAGNTFSSALQVCNMSTSEKLSLEIEAKEELIVNPPITEVLPRHTTLLEVRLKRTPLQTSTWPAAVRVCASSRVDQIFSKNDVVDISVRIFATNFGRVARHSALASMSFQSAGSGGHTSSVQGWMSGGVRANPIGLSKPLLPQTVGLQSLSQLHDALNSTSSSGTSSSYSSAMSSSSQPVTVTTNCITFPWTRVSNTSTSTLTLFNSSNTDKKVHVLSVRAPFSVEPAQFVVAAGWNFNMTINFSPQISGQSSEILTLGVDGQNDLLSITLKGPAVA